MAKNLKLKAARAALDMTQADLAAVVGVSRQTINAIEKGEYNHHQPLPQHLQGAGQDIGRAVLGGMSDEHKRIF